MTQHGPVKHYFLKPTLVRYCSLVIGNITYQQGCLARRVYLFLTEIFLITLGALSIVGQRLKNGRLSARVTMRPWHLAARPASFSNSTDNQSAGQLFVIDGHMLICL